MKDMEQITQEEVIRALSFFRSAIQSGEEWSPGCDALYAHITTALQAAEPVITVDIRRDPRDGSPAPRILKFADLGDGEHQLYALPCPPAKAQVPNMATIDDAPAYIWDEAERAAYAVGYNACRRAMLTASPVPNNDKDGCTCQGCGIVYAADLIVPDDWWEKIKPEGKAEGSGLLCPNCMMDRLVNRGWSAGHIVSPVEQPQGGEDE